MARILNFENGIVFHEQKESLLNGMKVKLNLRSRRRNIGFATIFQSPESIANVTGVAAVPACLRSVRGESLAAVRAGDFLMRSRRSEQGFAVLMPPLPAAGI